MYWIKRVEPEMANLREALEFGLTDRAEAALGIAASLVPFSLARGTLGEWRRWLDRALASTAPAPTIDRMWALYGAVLMAGLQNDLPVETSLVSDARALVEEMSDPVAHALFSILDGFADLVNGTGLDRPRRKRPAARHGVDGGGPGAAALGRRSPSNASRSGGFPR